MKNTDDTNTGEDENSVRFSNMVDRNVKWNSQSENFLAVSSNTEYMHIV